jgi:hypothetical protein
MSEDVTNESTEASEEVTESAPVPTPADLDKPLGPQGESALHAEKARRREESAKRRELQAELDALKASTTPASDIDAAVDKAVAEVTKTTDERIKRAEVKAVASEKLADASDAFKFLDLDSIEVGTDGSVNEQDVRDILDALITDKPYLAAQSGGTIPSPDAGARKASSGPVQLTREEIEKMSPEAIMAAQEAGQLRKAQGQE